MTYADWILDGTVATTILLLAWRVISVPALANAVVLFVAFGLMSALAWTRLGAVDVALVEASVGAGLSGALFMTALSWADAGAASPGAPHSSPPWRPLVALVLASGLASVVLLLPVNDGLTKDVSAHLQRTGVSQPVTAVLMNYRGYDTLLETVVLVVAAIAVRSVQGRRPRRDDSTSPDLLRGFVELLVPVTLLFSGYLVWRGSFAPGGAFQGGAVLAGGGVVLILANRLSAPRLSSRVVRACLLGGPALFLVLAGGPLVAGDRLLEYPPAWAGALIFAVESALAISIALVLVMFFPVSSRLEPGEGAREGR